MSYEVVRAVKDPTGRVVVEETDDRDTAFPLVMTSPGNVAGLSDFSMLWRQDLIRARRGHVILSANVITTAAFVRDFACIELNVVAYVASSAQVVFSTAIDSNIPLAEYEWDTPDAFGALAIEARQNVNGAGDSDVTGIATMTFTVAGFYWR